ncbi:MAG: ATP synthase F1 subunit epsilon [Metamycoplasmataceae bacterium]|uniref:ATP synthase F1 subunit epsilon n=1 Tax=Mycoplasmopsis lipophila TaxID=2117 RepID=UPI0038739CA5
MSEKTTHLRIITTDKIFFEDDVRIVTLNTSNGYTGILPKHTPFFTNIEIGKLTINYEKDPDYRVCTISNGLLYVDPEKISILTDDIIFADEIDIEKAEIDRRLALKNLEVYKNTHEALKYELKLKKALNRIDVFYSTRK